MSEGAEYQAATAAANLVSGLNPNEERLLNRLIEVASYDQPAGEVLRWATDQAFMAPGDARQLLRQRRVTHLSAHIMLAAALDVQAASINIDTTPNPRLSRQLSEAGRTALADNEYFGVFHKRRAYLSTHLDNRNRARMNSALFAGLALFAAHSASPDATTAQAL